jgi:hypothetical protein
MKRKITVMLLAFFMTVGMSSFAYAYRDGYNHGVKYVFNKFERYDYRPFHRFHRPPMHHDHHTVVVEKEYIPYREPYSGGTALDFGSIIVQLPQTVVFE